MAAWWLALVKKTHEAHSGCSWISQVRKFVKPQLHLLCVWMKQKEHGLDFLGGGVSVRLAICQRAATADIVNLAGWRITWEITLWTQL